MPETTPEVVPAPPRDLIPPALKWIAVVFGAGAVTASEFIPPPFSLIALVGGYLALFLGGMAGPSPLGSEPLIPVVAVPMVAMIGAALSQYALSLPDDSKWKPILIAASGLTAWLAGKGTPTPKLAVAVAAAGDAAAKDVRTRDDALKAFPDAKGPNP